MFMESVLVEAVVVAASGVMNFGKSRAKMAYLQMIRRVTFKDVAGADEEKARIRRNCRFLKTT